MIQTEGRDDSPSRGSFLSRVRAAMFMSSSDQPHGSELSNLIAHNVDISAVYLEFELMHL
jgi:hypothetical protein